jgi:hypothetical protein
MIEKTVKPQIPALQKTIATTRKDLAKEEPAYKALKGQAKRAKADFEARQKLR